MYEFRTRDEMGRFIVDEVCTGAEAQDILCISRQMLHSLVERRKLNPIFQRGQVTIFWRADVLQRKREMAQRRAADEPPGENISYKENCSE